MNPYKLLNIDQNASMDEIKTAFKQAARKYHPDLGGSHFDMAQINAAYEQLIIAHDIQKVAQDRINVEQNQMKVEQAWRDRYWKIAVDAQAMNTQNRTTWITWVLDSIEPPLVIWELHAKESGYQPEWAELKYLLQEKKKNART